MRSYLCLSFVLLSALVVDAYALTATKYGTVVDSTTGLIWQQDAAEPMSLLDAVKYCKQMELAGEREWRLPYKEELLTLAFNPDGRSTIDNPVFPGSPTERLWSLSYLPDQPSRFWTVNLDTAKASDYDFKRDQCSARCVLETPEAGYRALLQKWSTAWSAQDIETYLSAYGSGFVPEKGDRYEWEIQRRKRVSKPAFIQVSLSDIEVLSEWLDLVEMKFIQHYSSDGYEDQVEKILTLGLENGHVVILRERTL